jgi:hypothetical protein
VKTGVKFITRERDSFLPHCLSIVVTSVLSIVYMEFFPPVLERPEPESTHVPLYSVKVKKG